MSSRFSPPRRTQIAAALLAAVAGAQAQVSGPVFRVTALPDGQDGGITIAFATSTGTTPIRFLWPRKTDRGGAMMGMSSWPGPANPTARTGAHVPHMHLF